MRWQKISTKPHDDDDSDWDLQVLIKSAYTKAHARCNSVHLQANLKTHNIASNRGSLRSWRQPKLAMRENGTKTPDYAKIMKDKNIIVLINMTATHKINMTLTT